MRRPAASSVGHCLFYIVFTIWKSATTPVALHTVTSLVLQTVSLRRGKGFVEAHLALGPRTSGSAASRAAHHGVCLRCGAVRGVAYGPGKWTDTTRMSPRILALFRCVSLKGRFAPLALLALAELVFVCRGYQSRAPRSRRRAAAGSCASGWWACRPGGKPTRQVHPPPLLHRAPFLRVLRNCPRATATSWCVKPSSTAGRQPTRPPTPPLLGAGRAVG